MQIYGGMEDGYKLLEDVRMTIWESLKGLVLPCKCKSSHSWELMQWIVWVVLGAMLLLFFLNGCVCNPQRPEDIFGR